MGFETMEDLIPMPARFDARGQAIPFPKNVSHGSAGGVTYNCNETSGCDVLHLALEGDYAGYWVASSGLSFKLDKISAVWEDGGYLYLDPLIHGWAYAQGTVKTSQCRKTVAPKDEKRDSQHGRRYGRADVGEFAIHPNTTRIEYTVPGIYNKDDTGNDVEVPCFASKVVRSTQRSLLSSI